MMPPLRCAAFMALFPRTTVSRCEAPGPRTLLPIFVTSSQSLILADSSVRRLVNKSATRGRVQFGLNAVNRGRALVAMVYVSGAGRGCPDLLSKADKNEIWYAGATESTGVGLCCREPRYLGAVYW